MFSTFLFLWGIFCALHCDAFPADLSQKDDWLVHPWTVPATVSVEGNTITLSNGLLKRVFLTASASSAPLFCTTEYRLMVGDNATFLRALSPEGNVSLNGFPYSLGGCGGQPASHRQFYDPSLWAAALAPLNDSFVYDSHTVGTPSALFDWTPGVRHSLVVPWPPKGVALHVKLAPAQGTSAPDVTVTLHYEMYTGIPAIRKWFTVDNKGSRAVTVDSAIMEMLRAPNWSPERLYLNVIEANNPTPFTQQTVPEQTQSFPGRTSQYWYFDEGYDAPGDAELHVPYTYYTFLSVGYTYSVPFGGPTGPAHVLAPGDGAFDTLSVYSVAFDSSDVARQTLSLRAVSTLLNPQLTENPILIEASDISSTAIFRTAIDQLAAVGYDLYMITFGAKGWCAMCKSQLTNATFVEWMRSNVAYARAKGIEVGAYTLLQHNGWGESVPVEERVLQRNGQRGAIACFATDWWHQWATSVLGFIRAVGLTAIETDGEYEGAACSDVHGDHHHNGLAGSFSYQLNATRVFNMNLKALGLYQAGADAYSYSGANYWNHADTDASYRLSNFHEFLDTGRMYVFDSTTTRLPSSGAMGLKDLATFASTCGTGQARLLCFDRGLGSFFSVGVRPSISGPTLWPVDDPQASSLGAILKTWVTFYKKWRHVLLGPLIHIKRIDARSLDVMAHVNVTTREMLVSITNPTPGPISTTVPVSVYYAGFAPGEKVVIKSLTASLWELDGSTVGAQRTTVGASGGVYNVDVTVAVPSRSLIVVLITPEQ